MKKKVIDSHQAPTHYLQHQVLLIGRPKQRYSLKGTGAYTKLSVIEIVQPSWRAGQASEGKAAYTLVSK